MICKHCGNTKKFQSLITYYEPVEIWEFNDAGGLDRFNQPDTGDLDVHLSCPVCNNENVDLQGYDVKTFVESPLHRLDADQWEAKIKGIEQKA